MWEPTGKKATDRTTGAKLTEQRMTETGTLRWEVSLDGVVLGHVRSYEGYVDKKAPGSRVVHSRKVKIMWMSQQNREPGDPYRRAWYGHATRSHAVEALVKH